MPQAVSQQERQRYADGCHQDELDEWRQGRAGDGELDQDHHDDVEQIGRVLPLGHRPAPSPLEIETLDLLTRGFPPNAALPIIKPNTAIDNSLRHRLRHFAADLAEPLEVPTIEPSETARWFQRGH